MAVKRVAVKRGRPEILYPDPRGGEHRRKMRTGPDDPVLIGTGEGG